MWTLKRSQDWTLMCLCLDMVRWEPAKREPVREGGEWCHERNLNQVNCHSKELLIEVNNGGTLTTVNITWTRAESTGWCQAMSSLDLVWQSLKEESKTATILPVRFLEKVYVMKDFVITFCCSCWRKWRENLRPREKSDFKMQDNLVSFVANYGNIWEEN